MYILDVNTEIPAEVDKQLDVVSDFGSDYFHCICLGKSIIIRFIRIKLNGIEENEWVEVTWKYLKWSFKSKFKVEFKSSLSTQISHRITTHFLFIFVQFIFLSGAQQLLKYWTKGKRGVRRCHYKLSETQLENISGRLLMMGACVTKDFRRKPCLSM